MRSLLFLLLLLAWSCQSNESTSTPDTPLVFDPASLLESQTLDSTAMPFDGTLIQALNWIDAAGENTLIFSDKPAFAITDDLRRTEFFARAYKVKNDTTTLLWQLQEVIDSCYCDCAIELEGSEVTDIDQDGNAEVCFLFFRNDLCDASPMPTRLILASASGTYFLEGYTRLFLAPNIGLEKISTSENFDQAPQAFREYALNYWKTYLQKEESAFQDFKNETPAGQD